MIEVNESNFEAEVINSDVPVVVDFWAPWCGPCKALAPVLEQAAPAFEGKVKVVKLNVDESSDIAVKYRVRGVPTLMTFRNGEPVTSSTGFKPKAQLEDFLTEAAGV